MPSLSKISWLLVFTLFALPLLFFPFTYLAFELPKVFILYLFSALTLFFLLRSGYKASLNKTSLLLLILSIWIIFTAFLGLSAQQSFLGSYFRMQGTISWFCYGLLFFISGKVFENFHFQKQACSAILAGSVATALLAITQFISLWFFGHTNQLLYSNRVISTFGQPNFLGAYLVISLPFSWFLLKHSSKKWQRIIGLLILIVVCGVFVTFSRSAYIGLVILTLIWGIYHYRLLLAGVVFSIIIFTVLANLFPNLVFNEWYRFKLDTVSKWTAENRLQIVQKSLLLIKRQPLKGYGLENFSLAFPDVVNPQDFGLKDLVVDSSHNLFLDLTVQLGLIGLILFLSLISLTFIKGFKKIKQASSEQQSFIKINISAVVAFLVIHQFSPLSTAPLVLFWTSLGIINGSLIKQTNLAKKSKIFVNLSGITIIAFTFLFIVQTIRADILFREASAYEVTNIYQAISLDNEAIELAPWIKFYEIRRNFLLKQLGY